MMKKIICLVLAMLMVVPLLASCSGDDDAVSEITSDASQYTTTLNMWVMTESALVVEANGKVRAGYKPEDVPSDKLTVEQMTDKQKEVNTWSSDLQDAFLQVYAVEDAINDLTKTKFKTRIKLYYLTEENYYTGLESAFAAHEQAIADGSHQQASQNTTDETEIVDGIPQLKYPETKDYVVDVFYMDGYERYRSYIAKGWLEDMTTLLDTDAVEIGKYIDSSFLNAVKFSEAGSLKTYAIPNYHAVGEYTYLMVDKDLLAEYGRIPADITSGSIYDGECREFLDYIYEDKDNVYPIYTDSMDGALDIGPVYYWSHVLNGTNVTIDKDRFSLFGDTFADSAVRGNALSYDNLLADAEYMELLATKKYYESTDGYVTNDPAAKYTAAACVVKGDWALRHEYEAQGYAFYVMETPRVTSEDVFSSMFAIGGMTGYANRAMEVVAYLNTSSEIRNVLQYGVAATNYTLETVEYQEGDHKISVQYVVATSDNVYEMDLNKTGNVFIAYPEMTTDEIDAITARAMAQATPDMEPDEVDLLVKKALVEAVYRKSLYAQEKNLDMLTDLTLGLYYNYTTTTGSYALDVKSVNIITAVSARVEAAIADMTEAEVNYYYGEYSAIKADAVEVAARLLLDFGSDITYIGADGAEATVTVEDLTAALNCMADNKLVDEKDNDNEHESPNAFYQAWLASITTIVQ